MNELSPRKVLQRQRLERLRKFLREEGAETMNAQIRERFSWVSDYIITKVRGELGIPAPYSIYPTDKEMAASSARIGTRFLPPNQPEQKILSTKDWDRRKKEAKERAKKY